MSLPGIVRFLDYYKITYQDASSIIGYLSDKPLTELTLVKLVRSIRESFPDAYVEIARLDDWEDYLLLKIGGDFRQVLEKIDEVETSFREDLVRMEGWIQLTVI